MKPFKETVKFPFLIHRFEYLIETEITILRRERAEITTRLKRLASALTAWCGVNKAGPEAIKFALVGDEMELLTIWGAQNEIPGTVKISKYLELFDVPDYSGILEDARFLANKGKEVLLSYVHEKTGEITELETTKAEKEEIIERHSIYIHTQRDYDVYVALSLLCESANILNFKWNNLKGNRIEKNDLVSLLPAELKKYISREKAEEGSFKRRMELNFERFRQ